MFQSARIKLTIWYVLISIVVSTMFSTAIFLFIHAGLAHNEEMFQARMQRFADFDPRVADDIERHKAETESIERSLIFDLLSVNAVVLFASSLAGYFLSGRTLRPIQQMVDKQNQFISDASHELRTPLTALKTNIEVNLRDKELTTKQAKTVLEENLQDIDRLQVLSEDLLSLAKLQSVEPQPKQVVSIKEVVDTAMTDIATLAKKKQIEITTTIKDATVWGEKTRLIELLIILLDNAIKYSSEKTTITIKNAFRDGYTDISVKDEGVGIDARDLPHIFERFYRADKSRSDNKTSGYGLGLAIAKEIVEYHKGSIEVKSIPKKGTTFIVRLPVKRAK